MKLRHSLIIFFTLFIILATPFLVNNTIAQIGILTNTESKIITLDGKPSNCTDVVMYGRFLTFTSIIGNYYNDTDIRGHWSLNVKPLGFANFVTVEHGQFLLSPQTGIISQYLSIGLFRNIQLEVNISTTNEYLISNCTQLFGFFMFT